LNGVVPARLVIIVAEAVIVSSIDPACAAMFVVGSSPPTTWTRLPM